jgi:hypothetical protein
LTGYFFWIASNLVQDFGREPCFRLVLVSNTVNRRDGLFLATSREEVLRRLIEMEEEETTQEHREGQSTEGVGQIPPAHVVFLSAAGDTRGRVT